MECWSPPLDPGVYFWSYPVFEAVGYGKIQRDTARYVWIQLETVTVGSGQCGRRILNIIISDIARYIDIAVASSGYYNAGDTQ